MAIKNMVCSLAVLFFSVSSLAAEVQEARVNSETGIIEVDVSYGGGCQEHSFQLEIGMCLESHPVQCFAELKHNSNGDTCEAYLGQTLEFSMADYGLNDSYYLGGSLTIVGDNNSRVSITLPEVGVGNKAPGNDQVGDTITVHQGDTLPAAPSGYRWELQVVLESYPAQYVYELVAE